MRGLSTNFLKDLNDGILSRFLNWVKSDDTLFLEIRNNYVNIYYRGGNMFRIEPDKNGYKVLFDINYCIHTSGEKYRSILSGIKACDYDKWVENIPFIKAEMDLWFSEHPKLEREFQQLILRENNRGAIAGDTDYFIADIEYANNENGSRFDLLGVKWLSDAVNRRNPNNAALSFIEMKYGDNALIGSAGISKHIKDMNTFLSDSNKVNTIYVEMETIFNQKIQLGLVSDISKQININRGIKPEFIILIANHKPAKSVFIREVKQQINSSEYLELKDKADVKIAFASYMGYGLYADLIKPIENIINEN